MRVAIIAGSGGIGRWLLAVARENGDHVKTLVRDRRKMPPDLGVIGVIEGDARDPSAVEAVVAGCDVVFSALGGDDVTLELGTRNVLAAMKLEKTTRLLAVSCAGVDDDPQAGTRRFGLPLFFKKPLEGHRAMERAIVESDTVWSIVRPARLTDGPRTGLYRANERVLPERGREISRADVADFMVRTVVDERTIRKIAALSY